MRAIIRSNLKLILFVLAGLLLAGVWAARGWLLREVVAPAVKTRLAGGLQREITFESIDTNIVSFLSVKGFRMAKGVSLKDGTMIAAREVVIRYRLLRLIMHPSQWQTALRRVDLIHPYLELDAGSIDLSTDRKDAAEETEGDEGGELPPLPRTYLRVSDGSITLGYGPGKVVKIADLAARLDLRDLPRIEGSISFSVSPGAKVAASGACHLRLKDFKGALEVSDLDLNQLSQLARTVDPASKIDLGGFLHADLEVQGGFMNFRELVTHTTGRGRVEVREGSLGVGGEKLVTAMTADGQLEGRQIRLARLDANLLSGKLTASGSLDNLGFGKLRMEGKLEKAPVAAVRRLSPGVPRQLAGEFTFEFSATGTGRSPVFSGRLTAEALQLPGARVEDINAEAVYTLDEVFLTDLRARLWEGSFRGQGWIGGLRKGKASLNIELDGEGFDVRLSPIGKTYAGRAILSANIHGSLAAPVGDARIRVAGLSAHGVPIDDLEASARFEAGSVKINAGTVKGRIKATGTLLFSGGVSCEACRVDVQEGIVPVLALTGVRPPEGFAGHVSATVRIAGPLARPEIEASAVGSGLRLGRISLGDRVRVPKFAYREKALMVPASDPAEVAWDSENTSVSVHGEVPVSLFTGKGSEKIDCRVDCLNGRMGILQRLGLVKKAEGRFSLSLDLGGTSSYPLIRSLSLQGSGKRIVLNQRVFVDHIFDWQMGLEVKENEGMLSLVMAPGKRVRQEIEGPLAIAGWDLAMDLTTRTVGRNGLPLEIEDIASLRVFLDGRIVKEMGEGAVVVTGADAERGAEVKLANGVISHEGQGSKADEAGRREPLLERWAKRSLDFAGTVTFENNVSYKTKSLGRKALDAIWKATHGEGLSAISTASDVKRLLMGVALGFDVRVKDGSKVKVLKRGEAWQAHGRLVLEPGGELSLLRRRFVIVDIPGKEHAIEFIGGESLAARVWAVGETVLYDTTLPTDTGESATVDELNVRLVVTPREGRFAFANGEESQQGFFNYHMELVSEPEVVTGFVEVPGEEVQEGGGVTAMRPVTVRPTQGALLAALTGLGSMGRGFEGGQLVTSAAGGIIGGVVDMMVSPVRWMLEQTGLVDVFRVKRSSVARRRQAGRTTAPAEPGGGAQDAVASALENTEVTIGKNFQNLYVGYHGILLDASGMLGTGRRSTTAEQNTSPLGHELEVEFRRGRFKLMGMGRFYDLPDDVKLDQKPQEIFAGGEISQSFAGIGQQEEFEW